MTYGSNSILYEQLFFNISYTGSDVCRLMEMKWKTINIGYENMLGEVGEIRETMEQNILGNRRRNCWDSLRFQWL
jgi:hypothetical protein